MKCILIFLFLLLPYILFAQKVLVSKNNSDTVISLGMQRADTIQVLNSIKTKQINLSDYNEIGILTSDSFLKKIFYNRLIFVGSGEEPFWNIYLSHTALWYNDPIDGSKKKLKVKYVSNSFQPQEGFYAMFQSENGNIFGMIKEIEKEKQNCELCISIISRYEIYCNINGVLYKGCAEINESTN